MNAARQRLRLCLWCCHRLLIISYSIHSTHVHTLHTQCLNRFSIFERCEIVCSGKQKFDAHRNITLDTFFFGLLLLVVPFSSSIDALQCDNFKRYSRLLTFHSCVHTHYNSFDSCRTENTHTHTPTYTQETSSKLAAAEPPATTTTKLHNSKQMSVKLNYITEHWSQNNRLLYEMIIELRRLTGRILQCYTLLCVCLCHIDGISATHSIPPLSFYSQN